MVSYKQQLWICKLQPNSWNKMFVGWMYVCHQVAHLSASDCACTGSLLCARGLWRVLKQFERNQLHYFIDKNKSIYASSNNFCRIWRI